MQQLQSDYAELMALSQLFLLREYKLRDRVITDPQTHQFFRNLSVKANQEANLAKKEILPVPRSQFQNVQPNPIDPPQPISPQPDFPPSTPRPDPAPSLPKPDQPEPRPNPSEPQPQMISKLETKMTDRKETKGVMHSFQLEPFPMASQTVECEDFKQVLKQHFPAQSIRENIPLDHQAKAIRNTWHQEQIIPPIILLSFNDQGKHLAFLKNVATAISRYLAPARVLSAHAIEQEKKWETILHHSELRLVIASDYGLHLLPSLMKYYKEQQKTAKHFLHQTPLLLLSDLSLYLKEPHLKPLLWRAICTEFGATSKTQSLMK